LACDRRRNARNVGAPRSKRRRIDRRSDCSDGNRQGRITPERKSTSDTRLARGRTCSYQSIERSQWMLPVARDVARILAPSRIAERQPHPGVDHLAPTTRTRAWPESFGLALGIATARYPARRQPLNQQFDQRGRRLGLPFGWDLPHQGLHRPLHKNSEHRVRIHADRARHGDCLCEEIRRVGSVGGNPLNPTDELIDGRIWSVCHDPRMTSPGAMRQEQKVPTDPAAWPRLSPQCRQFTLNDRQSTRLSARKAPVPGKRVAPSGTTLHS
jgi:hypothetical protein